MVEEVVNVRHKAAVAGAGAGDGKGRDCIPKLYEGPLVLVGILAEEIPEGIAPLPVDRQAVAAHDDVVVQHIAHMSGGVTGNADAPHGDPVEIPDIPVLQEPVRSFTQL